MHDFPHAPPEEPTDSHDASVAAASKAVGERMLDNQTPRQRALAQQIYDRLKAGADVDDIKDLIADLSRTATEDERRRGSGRRTTR